MVRARAVGIGSGRLSGPSSARWRAGRPSSHVLPLHMVTIAALSMCSLSQMSSVKKSKLQKKVDHQYIGIHGDACSTATDNTGEQGIAPGRGSPASAAKMAASTTAGAPAASRQYRPFPLLQLAPLLLCARLRLEPCARLRHFRNAPSRGGAVVE